MNECAEAKTMRAPVSFMNEKTYEIAFFFMSSAVLCNRSFWHCYGMCGVLTKAANYLETHICMLTV